MTPLMQLTHLATAQMPSVLGSRPSALQMHLITSSSLSPIGFCL